MFSPPHLVLALLWTIGILVATNIPVTSVPDVGTANIDKLIHFGMFFGFGWLWMWALIKPLAQRFLLVAVVGGAAAVLTEMIQGFMPFDRSPNPWDMVANIAGLFAAMSLFVLWFKARHREKYTS